MIDIAGFTRITENSIDHSIRLSGLAIRDWFAVKEFTEANRPRLHMYVELERGALSGMAVNTDVLKEHLSVYFKYLDSDYNDLKKILGVDPLKITVVKCGVFETYENECGKRIRRINPTQLEISKFLSI